MVVCCVLVSGMICWILLRVLCFRSIMLEVWRILILVEVVVLKLGSVLLG